MDVGAFDDDKSIGIASVFCNESFVIVAVAQSY